MDDSWNRVAIYAIWEFLESDGTCNEAIRMLKCKFLVRISVSQQG